MSQREEKNHIDLIDPGHPFLPIVKACLEYQDSKRLSSKEICIKLSELKGLSGYQENLQCFNKSQTEIGLLRELKAKDKINISAIQQQQKEIREKNFQLQEKDKLFQKKESQFQRELATRERQIQQINHQFEEQQQITAKLQQSNYSLQRRVRQLEDDLSQQKQKPVRSSQPQLLSPPVGHSAEIIKREDRVYCSSIKVEPEQIPPALPLLQPHHRSHSLSEINSMSV